MIFKQIYSTKNWFGSHHHHVVLLAWISLTFSRHFSLSFITSGRSSGLHPISSHSCCMYVWAGHPAFTSSLLLLQCPACLVHLTCIVFLTGGRWPYSWCLVYSALLRAPELVLHHQMQFIVIPRKPFLCGGSCPRIEDTVSVFLAPPTGLWYEFNCVCHKVTDVKRPQVNIELTTVVMVCENSWLTIAHWQSFSLLMFY